MKLFMNAFVLAALFVAQSSSAMSKKQEIQVDVLVLDATMGLLVPQEPILQQKK